MFHALLILFGIGCITKDVDDCCEALVDIFEYEFEDEDW